jgi:hypothetical protein
MKDIFSSSKTRLRWAKNDISNVKKRVRKFLQSHPCAKAVEIDGDGLREVHKVKLVKSIPDSATRDTVKALEDLRAALDLATTSISVKANPSLTDTTRIHFPFCAKAGDLKSRINSACKHLPVDIQTLFEGFKPYSGGDDLLWALNELCNGSKHEIIVPVGLASGPIHVRRLSMTSGKHGGYIPAPFWDREKNEMVFGVCSIGAEFNYNLDFSLGIVFGDVPVVGGHTLASVLDPLLATVSNIVHRTEAECKRIGLI